MPLCHLTVESGGVITLSSQCHNALTVDMKHWVGLHSQDNIQLPITTVHVIMGVISAVHAWHCLRHPLARPGHSYQIITTCV